MSILDKIFGFERRIRKLRKTWDRRREKTLKKDEPIKSMCLEKLDRTEEKLRMLEERVMNRGERRRLAKEVEIELAEIEGILETKPEEMQMTQRLRKQE